jgi:phosphoglucosamine mutase
MSLKFGTDGVRGVANADLGIDEVMALGVATGQWLRAQSDRPHALVIGRDSRRSGPMLKGAFIAGLMAEGIDVTRLGIVPTGCISHAARFGEFGLGAVISASHNPAPDNGIKLLGPDGAKISESTEREISDLWKSELSRAGREPGSGVGQERMAEGQLEAYLEWLIATVPEGLSGMRVAVDAAHGAGFYLGVEVFRRLGAEVMATGTRPDGLNINAEGGATKPHTIQQLTRDTGADLGIAYDGDADRAVFSDGQGRLINGDRTIALWSAHWKPNPALVVGTVMSNGGFEAYMRQQGMELIRANVGDKYVSAELAARGGKIGGEQSGHIIFPEHAPTGDGLLTALQVARVLKREGRTAADTFGDFENWPQVLINLRLDRKDGYETDSAVMSAMADAQERLVGRGRINVRASGTQPVVRVMVEADEFPLRDQVATSVVNALLGARGGHEESRADLTYSLGD